MQVATGICLAMAYVPGGDEAYESLKYITDEAQFGSCCRGMHAYGASAMVTLVVIHLVQVYLHATYKYPRELNWMTGVVLFFVVLGMAFTGQLLAVGCQWGVVGLRRNRNGGSHALHRTGDLPLLAGRRNGRRIHAHTVLRLPCIHPAGDDFRGGWLAPVPALSAWRVGNAQRRSTGRSGHLQAGVRSTAPENGCSLLAQRDVAGRGVFDAGRRSDCRLCGIFGPPALDASPDPANIHANPMPDWYFWWYFAVLSLLPPSYELWFILGVPILGFLVLFCCRSFRTKATVPPASGRGRWASSSRALPVLWYSRSTATENPGRPISAYPELPADVIGATEGPVFEGAKLVHSKGCLYCHAIDGIGGHRGPDLSNIGEQLTREDLIIRINNGGYNMPSFAGSVNSEELSKIVDFLMTRISRKTASRRRGGN